MDNFLKLFFLRAYPFLGNGIQGGKSIYSSYSLKYFSMKNSIQKIEEINKSQIIHQNAQNKVKGGTANPIKICGQIVPSSNSDRQE